jgi:hypothetical protein
MGEKMEGIIYLPGAIEKLRDYIYMLRRPSDPGNKLAKLVIDLNGLQEAIVEMPERDRKKIEIFWGLKGGTNHSLKLGTSAVKGNIGFGIMARAAMNSFSKLLTLDNLLKYDISVSESISFLCSRVDKCGLQMSDEDIVKLILALCIYAENGPKMPYEEDAMIVDQDPNEALHTYDEFQVLHDICKGLGEYHEKSINMKVLMDFFENLDFYDMLAIKKSVGIDISQYFNGLRVLSKDKGIEEITDFTPDDVEVVRNIKSVRDFKERVFSSGAWNTTNAIILGKDDVMSKLSEFYANVSKIKNDWADIEKFCTSQMQIRLSTGVKTYNVYNIGGLEFTDIAEVMFLYSVAGSISLKKE